MIHDESDLDALARTLWGEARGESHAGREAVAWVIRNRAQRTNLPFFAGPLLGRAGAVHRVCHAPWQFSCWNEGDPNRAQILTLTPAQLAGERALATEVLEAEGTEGASFDSARRDPARSDPTQGADHYHTIARPGWVADWPPRWAHDYRQTVRIEHHVFYDSRRRT
jgi:N-acetylmuramoyl-L-alanine amidase